MKTEKQLLKRIRFLIVLFIVFLILSGITAFPIETELNFLMKYIDTFPVGMQRWLMKIHYSVQQTNLNYPQLAYGTDWLAFAHIVIGIAFIGPLNDPVKNIWIIQFGMIACVLIFPLALIAGPIRQIPFFWQLIDCSFGVFGMIPLYLCYKDIKRLEELNSK